MESTPEPPIEPFDPQGEPTPMSTPWRASAVRRVFIGAFGLRAFWSLLIYFTVLFFIIFGGHVIRHHMEAKRPYATTAARTTDASAPVTRSLVTAPMLTRAVLEDMTFPVFFLLS